MLDRVRNFLPLMSAANEELNKKIKKDGADAVNIENVTSENSPHVAMVNNNIINYYLFIYFNIYYLLNEIDDFYILIL